MSQLRTSCPLGISVMHPLWVKVLGTVCSSVLSICRTWKHCCALPMKTRHGFRELMIFVNFSWKTCNYTWLPWNFKDEEQKTEIQKAVKLWCIGWDVEICIHSYLEMIVLFSVREMIMGVYTRVIKCSPKYLQECLIQNKKCSRTSLCNGSVSDSKLKSVFRTNHIS